MPQLLKTTGWGGQEIRIFNDSGIQEQIDRAIDGLTRRKKHGAVIAVWDHKTRSISGAVVAKLGRDWSVVGTLRHRIGATLKDIDAGLAVRKEW